MKIEKVLTKPQITGQRFNEASYEANSINNDLENFVPSSVDLKIDQINT